MASTTYSRESTSDTHALEVLMTIVRPFASLKLTVVLFVLSMMIVFAGTLAQDEQNMLQVKQHYFTSWVTTIPFDVFVPQPFHPHKTYAVYNGHQLGIPFPVAR